MYNVDSLKIGIEKAKVNIQTFKDAIQKEHDTIKEYEGYIKVIHDKEELEQGKNIEVIKE